MRWCGVCAADQELADAQRVAYVALEDAMRDALSGALSCEEVMQRLGITPQAVSRRLEGGRLLALSRGRVGWFPAWQFHEDGVLPGLEQVITAYPGSALSLTSLGDFALAGFDGQTPAQALVRSGGVSRVLGVLRALVATV